MELEGYVRKGIPIFLDGVVSTPGEILEACFCEDKYYYMRDYISDEKGSVLELRFDKISHNKY